MKKYWKDILKAGDRLKISGYFENIGKITMNTHIIDVSPRKNRLYIVIATPNASGQLIPLILGMSLTISKDIGDGTYTFKSIVLDKMNYEEIKTSYMMSVPEYIEKTDRRSLKRLDINLELQFKASETNNKFEKGVTLDISGGGFSFITKFKKLKIDSEIIVNIEFDDFELKLQRCKITRGPIKKENGVFLYSSKFVDIKTHIQDKIIGFIFRKEVEIEKMNK